MTTDTLTDPTTDADQAPDVKPPDASAEPDTSDRPERDRRGKRRDDPAATDDDSDKPKGSSSSGSSKRGGRKRPRANAGKGRTRSAASLRQPIEQTLTLVGTVVATFDPFDGMVIVGRAEQTARALEQAAEANPAIRAALERLVSGGSGWGAVVGALAPIVLPIAWHHGVLPDLPMLRDLAPDEAQPFATRPGDGATDGPDAGVLADLAAAVAQAPPSGVTVAEDRAAS